MQNRPMAYNFLQCDFLLQQLLHTLPLVIFSFLSREVLYGKSVNQSSRKGPSLDFFVFSCFRYPRYQRITGHMPNCLEIFCLQLRLYGPVTYNVLSPTFIVDQKSPSLELVGCNAFFFMTPVQFSSVPWPSISDSACKGIKDSKP